MTIWESGIHFCFIKMQIWSVTLAVLLRLRWLFMRVMTKVCLIARYELHRRELKEWWF